MRSSRCTTGQVAENSVVDDATDACSLRRIFATFLGRFELRGDIYGKGGCVELTDGWINYTAIERTMGGRIDHTTTNQKSARMCVLRVGAVAPGETPPSNTAINRDDDEPPRINKQMRQAKLNLAVDLTIKLRSFDRR